MTTASIPARGRQVQLVSRPVDEPRLENFAVIEAAVPEPAPGQVLIRNTWMSVDPTMRIRMSASDRYIPPYKLGEPLDGFAVGEVLASRAEGFAPGDTVWHGLGWREFALVDATAGGGAPTAPSPEKLELGDGVDAKAYLGPLSLVGLTAYAGLFEVAKLKDGDVVFVSTAAGAVGALAVQIAKNRGHRVVASTGSAEKVRFVRDELGADAVFDYHDSDIGAQLAKAAPEGIDVYFDNVGGAHLQAALDALRPGGRVALCGAVSSYNAWDDPPPGPSNLFQAVVKGINLRGFLAGEFAAGLECFRRQMRAWLADGSVVYPETIVVGLENAPSALVSQMRGQNIGKVLVEIT